MGYTYGILQEIEANLFVKEKAIRVSVQVSMFGVQASQSSVVQKGVEDLLWSRKIKRSRPLPVDQPRVSTNSTNRPILDHLMLTIGRSP